MWLRMSEQILAQAPQHSQPSASRLSGHRWWPAAGRSAQWGHRRYAVSVSLMALSPWCHWPPFIRDTKRVSDTDDGGPPHRECDMAMTIGSLSRGARGDRGPESL